MRASGTLRPPRPSARCVGSAESAVFKAQRLLYHSTLGSRVLKKKRRSASAGQGNGDENLEFLPSGGSNLGLVDQPLHSRRRAVGEPRESAAPPAPGNEAGYGYSVTPYGTAYRSALRTSRIRGTTRLSENFGSQPRHLGRVHIRESGYNVRSFPIIL